MVDRAVTQPRIQLLGVDEAPAAGTLLAASHANYPAFRVVFPDSSVRSRVLLPFQAAAARDAARYGRFVGALLEDRLARVALWQPPGRFPLSFVRKTGDGARAVACCDRGWTGVNAVRQLRSCPGTSVSQGTSLVSPSP